MSTAPTRYLAATALAVALAAYATIFARQTHNHFDLPTFIDPLEWAVTLFFLAAAVTAYRQREQLAALLMVAALFMFYAVQADWLFRVPLGFAAVTVFALLFLIVLPVTWKPK